MIGITDFETYLAGEVVEELALDVVQRRGKLQLRLLVFKHVCVCMCGCVPFFL